MQMNTALHPKHPCTLWILLAATVAPPLSAGQEPTSQPTRQSHYDVTAYGATGDGRTKDTAAIQRAIDAAAGNRHPTGVGGGTVFFPAGRYLSGSLHLRDNITLHLDAGAVLVASPNNADFDPFESLPFDTGSDEETSFFHHALIWGEDVSRVAIVGHGTIDANRTTRGGPKPIAFKRCRFITIRDITIMNSPNYTISPLGCDDIVIDGVTILNGYCDGIDPDCCRNVRISNCRIETWDDAIVPKSSLALGEARPTENLTVTNCVLKTSCSGFKLGTESSRGFRYITASNLVIISPSESPSPDGRRMWTISGIAIEMVDGAPLEGVTVSNVTMQNVHTPIFVRLGNRGRTMQTPIPGSLRNVTISNVEATGAVLACSVTGIKDHPAEGVTLSNICVHYRGGGKRDLVDKPVPEVEDRYPEALMFGEQLPTYGLYCRHVRGLRLHNVEMLYDAPDERPALICEDVQGLHVSGFAGRSTGLTPFMWFHDVSRALITDCMAPPETGTFLKLSGEGTNRIRVLANDLSEAKKPFEAYADVPAGALFETANHLPQK